MRLEMLLFVFLEVAIEVYRELEVKFVLIFQGLTFLLVEVGSVDVDKEILGFIADEGTFLLKTTVYLNLKIELLIQRFVEIPGSGVYDYPCEVADNGWLFLELGVVVIFCSGTVKHLLYRALLWIEDGVEGGSAFLITFGVNNCRSLEVKIQEALILRSLIMIFRIHKTLTESFQNENIYF